MKTVFVICTALTVLQIFDVSITGISALRPDPSNPMRGGVDPAARKPRIAPREVKKPENKPNNLEPANEEPGTNPNEDESPEVEPTTIKESGKRVVRTAKKVASRRGAGLLNSFTGLLKTANNTADFFGRFLRDRSKNVKDVARESMGMVSSFSNRSANGAKHLMNSARVIGEQSANTAFSTLQKSTSLGKNVIKLGGTVVSTPISIGEDVVSTANSVLKVPAKVSRTISDAARPFLSTFGSNSDEGEPEEEAEEEKPPKVETPKAPTPALPTKRKPVVTKPQGVK